MIYRQKPMDDENNDMAEKIKQEIVLTLQRKGIKLSNIHVGLHSDNINVSISINKEK